MPHYGILRDHKMEDVDDLRGADVYGVNDEKLGTIDDVIFDHSSGDIRYIVLKTGGLLSRKKVMVPANRVEPYGNHDDKFYAELDKERLEMLPEFKEDTMKAQGDWSTYEKDYEKRWNDGVMYNRNTGRDHYSAARRGSRPHDRRQQSASFRQKAGSEAGESGQGR